jgi:hypothetical protein
MTNRMTSHRISHKNRNLLFIITLILIVGVGLPWMLGSSASSLRGSLARVESESDPVRSELMTRECAILGEKAAQEGMVRVIVGLQTITEPIETASGQSPEYATPETIEALQTSLLEKVTGYDPSSVKRFHYIPYLALKVNASGLESLRRATNVVSIQEDTPLSWWSIPESTRRSRPWRERWLPRAASRPMIRRRESTPSVLRIRHREMAPSPVRSMVWDANREPMSPGFWPGGAMDSAGSPRKRN